MPRIQLKLIGALALLVLLTSLVAGFVAERGVREQAFGEIERSLGERSRLVAELVGEIEIEPRNRTLLSRLASRARVASGARVSFIAPDGEVVADSDVAPEKLDALENHRERPEVREALEGRPATNRRRSSTVHEELFYMALPHLRGAQSGVVRLAVRADEVDAAVAALRRRLAIAGGFGVVAAFALSFPLARRLIGPLERMRRTLAAISRGDLSARMRWRSNDELGEIAQAIDRMGEELEGQLVELGAGHGQLQAILGGMVDGVLLLDDSFRIELANSRLCALLGLADDVAGRPVDEVIRQPEVRDLLGRTRHSFEPRVTDVHVTTPRELFLRVQATGLTWSGRKLVVAVFHDMTDVQRVETMRRDFVANASHEIRTPLTAIRGFAETLLSTELPREEFERYMGIVLENSRRLGELVDDLLELSRIESGVLELRSTSVDPGSIARMLLRQLEPRFKERRIGASVSDADAPEALGDPRAVEQVLLNLLDNALKYTEPGGSVEVRVVSDDGFVRVEVSDTGIGIQKAEQARIFERFYRVDKARARKQGGTGLGLSIVKHLVQAMGGQIAVESTPGVGSCFRFTLPRPRASQRRA